MKSILVLSAVLFASMAFASDDMSETGTSCNYHSFFVCTQSGVASWPPNEYPWVSVDLGRNYTGESRAKAQLDESFDSRIKAQMTWADNGNASYASEDMTIDFDCNSQTATVKFASELYERTMGCFEINISH